VALPFPPYLATTLETLPCPFWTFLTVPEPDMLAAFPPVVLVTTVRVVVVAPLPPMVELDVLPPLVPALGAGPTFPKLELVLTLPCPPD